MNKSMVIFSDNTKYLNNILRKFNISNIAIVQIKYDVDTERILNFLRRKNIKITFIEQAKFIRDYEKIYSAFIGKVNVKNANLFWWALNFTNKNPITTYLCNRVYYACLLNKIVDEGKFDHILVIDNDSDLFEQIKLNFTGRSNVKIINSMRNFNIKKVIKSIIPLAIFYASVAAVINKIISLVFLSKKAKSVPNNKASLVVVMSLLYNASFKNNQYKDVYFGEFVDYLKDKNISFISFMEVCSFYLGMLKKSKLCGIDYNIFTKEFFISFRNIFICVIISLQKFFGFIKVNNIPRIYGIDLTMLVNKFIRYEYTSTRFFCNLLMFYAVSDFSRKYNIKKFYYPFENRSFEKMMILALRRFSPHTKIIGYQHASISLRHTNFLLDEDEYKIIPLPHLIITMGEMTKEIMKDFGNFPENLLKVGCALRQNPFKGKLKNRKDGIKNIFVVLATNLEEYVKVLQFLDESLGLRNSYDIWIRPHPVFSLEHAMKMMGSLRFKFHKANQETLEECYDWADVVLYVHSTLSIEAMMRGIPVINLVIPNILNPDPLFNFTDFKWRVNNPKDLLPTIRKIEEISEENFTFRQKKARNYALNYIYETTNSAMADFLRC